MTSSTESLGLQLRRMREEAGLSLADLAALTHYSKGYLSKVEHGLKMPSQTFTRACDAALKSPGALSAIVLARPPESPSSDQVRRRPPPPAEVGDTSTEATPRLTVGPPDLTPLHGSAHAASLDFYRRLLEQMRDLGQSLGPSHQLPILNAHYTGLIRLSERFEIEKRREALRLAARFAEYAGWMAQEAGDDTAALKWTDQAVENANEAHDFDLVAYAFVRRALITLYKRDALGTIENAQKVRTMACSPRVKRLAAQREAQGWALAGDYQRFLAAMELVEAIRRDEQSAEQPDLPVGSTHVPDTSALARGWCLQNFGMSRESADILGELLSRTPVESERSRARIGARYALALASVREFDKVSVVVRELEACLPGIESATILYDVKLLAEALSRWHADPVVRQLMPVLTALLRTPQGAV